MDFPSYSYKKWTLNGLRYIYDRYVDISINGLDCDFIIPVDRVFGHSLSLQTGIKTFVRLANLMLRVFGQYFEREKSFHFYLWRIVLHLTEKVSNFYDFYNTTQ